MNVINEAARLAWMLHHGQTRAGGGLYINHPMRVAGLVSIFGDTESTVILTNNMIAAAWLHDVYEDTYIKSPSLNCINPTVEHLVNELTNRFTKAVYPSMNRASRKKAETERLSTCSPAAQIIKLCDRIDNLDTIQDKKGKKFHTLYCDESYALVEAISVSPILRVKLYSMIARIRKEL